MRAEVIARGSTFDLDEHVSAKGYTIFYFAAEWCPFCRELDAALQAVIEKRSDVAVRKIEIVNWESDAAKQAARAFALDAVPYVRVHGPGGRFLGHVKGNDAQGIKKLIE